MLSTFINLRKGLVVQFLLLRIWFKKYLVAIRQIIKVLPGNLLLVNECATMPSVKNVTRSAYPITLLKGAPRLRAQCALKRDRTHVPLNRGKG